MAGSARPAPLSAASAPPGPASAFPAPYWPPKRTEATGRVAATDAARVAGSGMDGGERVWSPEEGS